MPKLALLTALEASKRFSGLSERTARRRLAAAVKRQDPDVVRIANAYCVSEEWWRNELLRAPLRPQGRPPQKH